MKLRWSQNKVLITRLTPPAGNDIFRQIRLMLIAWCRCPRWLRTGTCLRWTMWTSRGTLTRRRKRRLSSVLLLTGSAPCLVIISAYHQNIAVTILYLVHIQFSLFFFSKIQISFVQLQVICKLLPTSVSSCTTSPCSSCSPSPPPSSSPPVSTSTSPVRWVVKVPIQKR